jgi:hypothetical protein
VLPCAATSAAAAAAATAAAAAAFKQIRTSMGVFLNRTADPSGLLAAVEDKIAAVTHILPSHGEVRAA